MKAYIFSIPCLLAPLLAVSCLQAGETHAANFPLNQAVLSTAYDYADGGEYNTQWSGSGTPERIEHKGRQILAEGTGGTYCSGFTFATVMKTAGNNGLLDGKDIEEVKRFQKEWYGAVEDPQIREKQCALAVGNLSIGREVSMEEARPGDFVQFWRARSGHSVVFLGWVRDDEGHKAGLKYRSSQGSTDGIGDNVEYFRGSEVGDGHVDPERIYFARLSKSSSEQ